MPNLRLRQICLLPFISTNHTAPWGMDGLLLATGHQQLSSLYGISDYRRTDDLLPNEILYFISVQKLDTQIKRILNDLTNKSQIMKEQWWMKSSRPILSQIGGYPKIHSLNIPLYSTASLLGFPVYTQSRTQRNSCTSHKEEWIFSQFPVTMPPENQRSKRGREWSYGFMTCQSTLHAHRSRTSERIYYTTYST